MEFNALQQYRSPADAFPFVQQRSRTAGSIMYSSGTYAALPQATQATTRASPHQPFSTWSFGSTTPKSYPMNRRNTVMLDSRTQPSDPSQSRPLNMTAQAIRSLGLQNPQGEYLPQPTMAQPPVQQVSMPQTGLAPNAWNQQKGCGEFDFGGLEPDLSDLGQGMLHHDEDTPIIDLRQYTNFDADNSQDIFNANASRRMSESSFSMSSNGPLADVPTFEDFAKEFSTSEISIQPDCDWTSLEPPAQTLMSPMASPRPQQHESLIRSSSRSRASPVPNLRASPYTLESGRNKRWSTGMYPSHSTPPSRPHQFNRYSSFYGSSPLNPHQALGTFGEMGQSLQSQPQSFMFSQGSQLGSTLFSSPDQAYPEAPRPLPSQGLFRLLQSNADRLTGCSSHFADLSDPPDLYSSLHEEPSNPPEEDMNPTDPDMMPHEQDLRFQGDLYTPRWVRGHGNKREGWCGLCKPGRWLVLKNSAFWYDKSFTHGVSAATGAAFQGPQETRRTEGNLDVWEGLCGSCGDWIALVSSKKKGTTWFRHAYKCHTHPKVKDGPKRRRETTTNLRTRAPSVSAPSQQPQQQPQQQQQQQQQQHEQKPQPQHQHQHQHQKPQSQPQPQQQPQPNSNTYSEGSQQSSSESAHTTITAPVVPEVKTEHNNPSPLSTPQLTHTQLSTPQISTMQTPSTQQSMGQTNQYHQVLDMQSSSMFNGLGVDTGQHYHDHTGQHSQEDHNQHFHESVSHQYNINTAQHYLDDTSHGYLDDTTHHFHESPGQIQYREHYSAHTLDPDDIKTMNPLDSFANMI